MFLDKNAFGFIFGRTCSAAVDVISIQDLVMLVMSNQTLILVFMFFLFVREFSARYTFIWR